MDAYLRQSLEMLGLPVIVQEPEVVKADLARIQCKTLASFIADALSEEPLLKVERDGATVTVTEIGGSGAMTFTVEAKQ